MKGRSSEAVTKTAVLGERVVVRIVKKMWGRPENIIIHRCHEQEQQNDKTPTTQKC